MLKYLKRRGIGSLALCYSNRCFGSIQNANRLKLQVTQIGYDVEISKVQTRKSLNAVRAMRFRSKSAAEKLAKQ